MERRTTRWAALIPLVVFSTVVGGCGRQEAISPSDRNLLLLQERIPLGSTPADVRKARPSVGVETSEGLGTEMKTKVAVLGGRADLEFNFQRDSLYAVSFNPGLLSGKDGDALFNHLVAFYSERYGPARVSDGADDPYYVKSREWRAGNCEVGVSCSLVGNKRQLGWVYQVLTNVH